VNRDVWIILKPDPAGFAVARLFDRERLITGTEPTSGSTQQRYRVRGA